MTEDQKQAIINSWKEYFVLLSYPIILQQNEKDF